MTINKKLIIIFTCIFVVFAAAAVIINSIQPEDDTAIITVNGKEKQEVDLNKDRTFVLQSNGGTNTIEVRNGMIYIVDASCPDKLCVRHGELHNKYDAIVCLPNKVVIEYRNSVEIDAVAGR